MWKNDSLAGETVLSCSNGITPQFSAVPNRHTIATISTWPFHPGTSKLNHATPYESAQ